MEGGDLVAKGRGNGLGDNQGRQMAQGTQKIRHENAGVWTA